MWFDNCGSTAFPLVPETADLLKEHQAGLFADTPWDWLRAGEFFASLERAGPVSNIAQLVGHGALRVAHSASRTGRQPMTS